jgi:protein O-mannosyl-transferase
MNIEHRPSRAWIWPTLVALLAISASIGGLLNQFAQDDIPIIWKNPALQSLRGIGALFLKPYWPPPWIPALYRPFASASFILQWVLGGGSPMMFRAVSYLLYAAVSVGVFELARLRLPVLVAFATAALFAVHPLHVEAVAVAVNQSELWVGLICCVAVVLYVRLRAQEGPLATGHQLLLTGLYLVACLFKESALVLPGLLVAAEVLLVQSTESIRTRIANGRRFLLILVLVAVAFLWVRTRVLSGNVLGTFEAESFVGLTMGGRALTMLGVVPEWARLMLWPAHLQADYGEIFPATEWGPYQTLGLLILIAVAVAAVAAWRRAPVITFGLAWCAIGLFPVHNVLAPTGIVLAERTLFLPSIGVVIALGGVGALLLERPSRWRQLGLAAAAGTLLILGEYRSTTRHSVWSDQFNLWYQTANVDAPKSFRAHEALAESYFKIGVERMAEHEYRLAIKYSPSTLTRPMTEYAERLRSRGFSYPAADLYRKITGIHPSDLLGRAALIACLLDLGRYREAMFQARMAISYSWELPAFQAALATADSALRVNAPPGTVRVKPPGLSGLGPYFVIGAKKTGVKT